ncbi:2-C-methyl-D-erythritol 4-phosphate cytidylyltransferase [Niabella beijingensis]|uniref:2-C-methyl-D-erythritol 4-phosphate cytidylyltransferase n=1 Tax=Niabella beijingensis TaxID=2872700 RepID=UPI001CBDF9F4|nr:2-C-methyl-D-erythritol 4-phosphate cytidylyltransferase [Niabella beijingensis]MBZ4192119.1 2-C-methyl-D-erythritol 4-phosphate cytidylyltransferase [Niabella beijingensis]
MKKTAVIVAGGTGVRMGTELPKQFLLLKNKPLLYYTIDTFLKTYEDLDIVLVLPEAYTDMGQEIIDAYFDKDRVRLTIGGVTRFESVKNGLQLIDEEAIIFVHDAVRCLVSSGLIRRCYEQAVETGSAIPVVPSSDSVRLLTEDGSDALERDKIVLVQTPQVFHSKILIPAFSIGQKEKFTDEASVVEAFGMKVSLVEGEKNNIKITHPVDLAVAAQLLT